MKADDTTSKRQNNQLDNCADIDFSNSLKTPIFKKTILKKKNRNKEKRQKRLLKFQQTLDKTCGLPLSRLIWIKLKDIFMMILTNLVICTAILTLPHWLSFLLFNLSKK